MSVDLMAYMLVISMVDMKASTEADEMETMMGFQMVSTLVAKMVSIQVDRMVVSMDANLADKMENTRDNFLVVLTDYCLVDLLVYLMEYLLDVGQVDYLDGKLEYVLVERMALQKVSETVLKMDQKQDSQLVH